jgi:hypothetical protein
LIFLKMVACRPIFGRAVAEASGDTIGVKPANHALEGLFALLALIGFGGLGSGASVRDGYSAIGAQVK